MGRGTEIAGALAAVAALALSGCASIMSGNTDSVRIDNEPSKRECNLYQGRDMLDRITTPETVVVPRKGASLLVTCGEDRARAESGVNGWVLGNFLLTPIGTVIGIAVDMGTGAEHGYDDVTVKKGGVTNQEAGE